MVASNIVIVDYQAHWFPEAYLDALMKRSDYPRVRRVENGNLYELGEGAAITFPPNFSDLDALLAEADENGVDVLVTAPATLGDIWSLPGEEVGELFDIIHAEYARAQREHRGRVVGVAALPMNAPEVALDVLDRAVSEFGLRGISVLSSSDGGPVAAPERLPIYARAAELGLPVFIHPGFLSATRLSNVGNLRAEGGLGWMYETARAALNFVDSGTLDELPDLVVVHPHLGGVLPYVAGRAGHVRGGNAKHRLEKYLAERFYVDTVGRTPLALSVALQTYGPEKVVFGTDAPFMRMAEARSFVESIFDATTAAKIYANRVPGLEFGPA